MLIRPAKRLRGRVRVPGDKSISHRAAIIAALARGASRVENFSSSADCSSTLECLRGLGVGIEREGTAIRVEGAGMHEGAALFRPSSPSLDCGNSGTTMRLLAGVLAAQPFVSTLAGDDSLSQRPMRRVVEPLEMMGARVSSDKGHAPLRVEGRRSLKAIEYEAPVASAQVKSCILLAGLGAEGSTRVVERGALTRDHTERMLEWLGAETSVSAETVDGVEVHAASVVGPASPRARDIYVPGDISSAAFLLAAAAVLPGSDLTVERVGLNPTRSEILQTLRGLGADAKVEDVRDVCNEPVGDARVRGASTLAPESTRKDAPRAGGGEASTHERESEAQVCANVLRGALIARLIDELPVLAVVGTQVLGGVEIRDARELRVKESDRIAATVENLRAMGAQVEEFDDGLRIDGPSRLRGARLRSFGDHRIAMAFAVAALVAEGETFIEGAQECVGVSFPEFFALLESVTER
jgi:3-phosphoshikimate 1-carboxyvinyltransferase